ncbi:MAG: MBOAT family protein, partial [Paludibacteraceae bacterium]|nr:MBOAT family protein [Paludibacteraceae bacterium]
MELLALLKNIFSFDDAQPLLFTQFYFWVFFAFVFAVFSLFRQKILLRNTFLFFVSLFFYYKTSGLFTLILLFVTIFNFFIGKLLFGAKQKRFLLIVSIVLNLLVLCYFKYAYFFIDVLNDMFGTHFKVFDVFSHIGNIATNSS